MTNDLRVVRDTAVGLERQLEALGATGDGLGQKYRSLNLPDAVQSDLRQVVHLRNMVMHDGVDLSQEEMQRFTQAADRASAALAHMPMPGTVASSNTSARWHESPAQPSVKLPSVPGGGATKIFRVILVLGLAWLLSSLITTDWLDIIIWIVAIMALWDIILSVAITLGIAWLLSSNIPSQIGDILVWAVALFILFGILFTRD